MSEECQDFLEEVRPRLKKAGLTFDNDLVGQRINIFSENEDGEPLYIQSRITGVVYDDEVIQIHFDVKSDNDQDEIYFLRWTKDDGWILVGSNSEDPSAEVEILPDKPLPAVTPAAPVVAEPVFAQQPTVVEKVVEKDTVIVATPDGAIGVGSFLRIELVTNNCIFQLVGAANYGTPKFHMLHHGSVHEAEFKDGKWQPSMNAAHGVHPKQLVQVVELL